ncbi:Kelch repeat type 1 [Corchorus olitorius]|uniref:Kelch repeat type 1 n=1 Tax=Corchorus olitorius TaxID=93759 RepID=A0A1R3H4N2_9ROSI|nr:Kelch repeat type 1 [Corchorus olitorius]
MAGNDTSSHKDFKLPSTTKSLAAEVGCEASHSSTKQQQLREAGIKRIYTIEGCSWDYSFRCFVLDLENGEETTLTISPASEKDKIGVHLGFSAVALGSIIYLIGGYCSTRSCPDGLRGAKHPHRYVRYFDANEPEKGWKLGVPMQTGRAWAAAAAIDEKIYVFGGLMNKSGASNNDVFGECFDSKTNKWSPLTVLDYKPTCRVDIQVPYVPKNGNGKKSILINSFMGKETLYEYLLDEQEWRIVDQTFGKCVNQGAILDDILYTVWEDDENPFHGFDLIRKQWFPVDVKLPKLNQIAASVFPSGSDKLCLVWHFLENKIVDRSKYRRVECLELKPNKSSSPSGELILTASVEYHQTFYVPSSHFQQYFLPMEV